MRSFLKDRSGAAAVEFAIIVPVLVALVMGLMLVWEPAVANMRMRAAVHAGATYVRQGGADDTRIRSVVAEAWQDRAAGSVISVSRQCLCGAAAQACTTICADQRPPSVYVTVRATSQQPERTFGKNLDASEVVRVR